MLVPEWTLLGDGKKFSLTSGAQNMDMSHAPCGTLHFLSISGGAWGCGCDSENVHSLYRPFWENIYLHDFGGTELGVLGGPAPPHFMLHSPDCTSDTNMQ